MKEQTEKIEKKHNKQIKQPNWLFYTRKITFFKSVSEEISLVAIGKSTKKYFKDFVVSLILSAWEIKKIVYLVS